MANISNQSDEEIERCIQRTPPGDEDHKLALEERHRRDMIRLARPHWTVPYGFAVTVFAAIVALLAAYFAYLAIPLERRPFGLNQEPRAKSDAEQKQQTQSAEPLSTKEKMSPSLDRPPKPPNSRAQPDARQSSPR